MLRLTQLMLIIQIGLPKESVLKKIDAVVHFHEDLLKVKEVLKMNIQQKLHQ